MVIQRWQSVLLLVAAVMMGCFSFMSLGQVQLPDYSLDFTSLGFTYEGEATAGGNTGYYMHTWILFVVNLMCAIIPFINIFLFKNLKLQKRCCLIEVLFIVASICLVFYYGCYGVEGGEVSWSSLLCAPLFAFIADVMAYNRIRSDERAIRSSERIY